MPQFSSCRAERSRKSTFSARFSRPNALIFDPDEQKLKIEKQYPDISHDALESAVTDKYHKFELKSIGVNIHLTVETNLRNEFLAERAEFFKGIGYETRLVYMLLPNVTASMERVNLRVQQKGHFVDVESIKTNFEEGLKNLRTCASKFDQVMLVSGRNNFAQNTQPQLLFTAEKGVVKFRNANIPEWCLGVIDDLEQFITGHQSSRARSQY